MSEGEEYSREKERERNRVCLELFVSEATANLSKNMFDPFIPPEGGQPPTPILYGRYGEGTAQTVNRIFIILQR